MDTDSANAVIDNISIIQLQERYGLASRQTVYNWLKNLDIEPKRGKINAEQLKQVDEFYRENQDPNKSSTLTAMSNQSNGQTKKSNGQMDNQLAVQPEMLMAMFEALAARPQQQPEPSAIASLKERLELLELCCQQGNTLSTSELSEVLGLKADSLRDKKRHSQYGYSFSRAGKHSHELAWKIEKSYS